MDPTEAAKILAEALGRTSGAGARSSLVEALSKVASRMDPIEAARICGQASGTLAEALDREADKVARYDLTSSLAMLAKGWRKPGPSDVWPIVQSLAAALKAEKDPERRGEIACALAPMAERLGPEQASRICISAAESLSADWTETNKFVPGQGWVRGLGEMMIRLPADGAARTARRLAKIAHLGPVAGEGGAAAYVDAQNFYVVLSSLDADDAARTARVLVAALRKENDPSIRWWLAAGLCMMAEKMDSEEAARVCSSAVGDMGAAVAVPSYYREQLINEFAVVASRQTPAVAGHWARPCRRSQEGGRWSDCPGGEMSGNTGQSDGAGRGGEHLHEAARCLADSLKENPVGQDSASCLAVLAARMRPVDAARICGQAAKSLAEALAQATDVQTRSSLASALSEVAGSHGPD